MTLRKLGINPEKVSTLYQARTQPLRDQKGNPIPCEFCHELHFKGRTGVYEMLDRAMMKRGKCLTLRPLAQPGLPQAAWPLSAGGGACAGGSGRHQRAGSVARAEIHGTGRTSPAASRFFRRQLRPAHGRRRGPGIATRRAEPLPFARVQQAEPQSPTAGAGIMYFSVFFVLLVVLLAAIVFFHYVRAFSAPRCPPSSRSPRRLSRSHITRQIVESLLAGKAANTAHAMMLLILFAAIYMTLRIISDVMIPGQVRLPAIMDKVGGAVMGLVAGIFAARHRCHRGPGTSILRPAFSDTTVMPRPITSSPFPDRRPRAAVTEWCMTN